MKNVLIILAAALLSLPARALYVDAEGGASGNTFRASDNSPTAWYAAVTGSVNEGLWGRRTPYANNPNFTLGTPNNDIFEGGGNFTGSENCPLIVTVVSGLVPGNWYDVDVVYWSTGSTEWCVRAGFTSGAMTLFARTTAGGATAGTPTGKVEVDRNELLGRVGRTQADASGQIRVYIDDKPQAGHSDRTWYDGLKLTDVVVGPQITAQPLNAVAALDAAKTVRFTVGYQDNTQTVSGVTWYKNSAPLPADPDYSVTWNQTSGTLTIANVTSADLDSYYCLVSDPERSAQSRTVYLSESKQLAGYQFEANASDSVGSNHGTVIGAPLLYTADTPGTVSGQLYAADPNGTNCIQLPADAYPKVGPGSGLDTAAVSFWLKLAPDAVGTVFGSYNGTASQFVTGLRCRVDANGKVHFHLRDEDGHQAEPVSTKSVDDNQWHFVTASSDGSTVTLCVDVTDRTVVTPAAPVDNFAPWQYPLTLLADNNRGILEDFLPAVVDDLKFYNYPRTQEDAAIEYYDVTGLASCVHPDLPGLAHDFNGDCKVNLADFARLAAAWLDNG